METNKWIDFIIKFTKKLRKGDYNGAIDMTVDIDFNYLTESQGIWLDTCITKIREKHNI